MKLSKLHYSSSVGATVYNDTSGVPVNLPFGKSQVVGTVISFPTDFLLVEARKTKIALYANFKVNLDSIK